MVERYRDEPPAEHQHGRGHLGGAALDDEEDDEQQTEERGEDKRY